MRIPAISRKFELAALVLRVGLGLVFVIGGTSKLSLLFNSSTHDAMIANYLGSSGYINSVFQDYLFTGMLSGVLSPGLFLSSLSLFELLSGVALIVGLMVRPLALFYAFLLWTFVIALPVLTVPGIIIEAKTYTSPALLVQIRDITLSGMMFVLFNIGAGLRSVDKGFGLKFNPVDWQVLGLLLRFSLGITFVVAGFFGAFSSVPNFATWQPILASIGLLLMFGNEHLIRAAALVAVVVFAWYILNKLNLDKSILANLNGIKREFALAAASMVILTFGGGERFSAGDICRRSLSYIPGKAAA